KVEAVCVANRRVVGVRGRQRGRPFEIEAPTVVLAAGGLGTPPLLWNAGLHTAGRGIGMDTRLIMYGHSRIPGNGHEPPMTYAYEDQEHGYMLSTLIDPWLNYPIITSLMGPRYLLTWPRWSHTLGVMIKLKDDVCGEMKSERDISKPFMPADRVKLDHAAAASRRILIKAGADPDSLFLTPMRGTHPCATVRVGELLDHHLQTEVEGLYVCDAGAFPEALARPTVLTIIALGKRLVNHLLSRSSA
ncbi:MAG: GMC oxidoreductase, partial [Anaerolineales bacterium]